MQDIVEITLTKYPTGKTPKEGKVVWGVIIPRNKHLRKEKAIRRLTNYIENRDKDRAYYAKTNKIIITKMLKNGKFNGTGEVIFEKKFNDDNINKHHQAGKRLALYLSENDDKYIYFCTVPYEKKGKFWYQLSSRDTVLLDKEDKQKIIKNKIRARKGAITRNINKAKKIRERYMVTTLFSKEYKTDSRFVSLVKHLSEQRKRLKEAKRMTIDSIPDVVGKCEVDRWKYFND